MGPAQQRQTSAQPRRAALTPAARPEGKAVSFLAFTVLSLGGLGITWLVMAGGELAHVPYGASKVAALGLAFAWNFLSRKLLLFRPAGDCAGRRAQAADKQPVGKRFAAVDLAMTPSSDGPLFLLCPWRMSSGNAQAARTNGPCGPGTENARPCPVPPKGEAMPSLSMMPASPCNHRAGWSLLNLVDRPVLLFLVLLAANAITRPYANIDHDARLYSLQVLNQAENGSYQNDLFLRYGSQDKFSLFSLLLAPAVKVFGLEPTFFVVYLAANVLFVLALSRLVRRLVEDRLLALLALLCLVIAPLNYGGSRVFHVHEPFLTPRLLAVALVLFRLDRLLQTRYRSSLLLMVLAGLLHPLMAVGGLLTWAGVFLVDWLGWRPAALVAGGCALAGAAFLAMPSVAGRFLGTMDDAWRDAVLRATPFNFVSEWAVPDWINVLLCGVGLAAGVALNFRQDPRRACFNTIVFLVGVAAVLGTLLAGALPYALPLQGQPYRALWILKVLQIPLCFVLADRLWRSDSALRQVFALALLAFFVITSALPVEWCLPLFFLPVLVVYFRGLERQPRRPDWVMCSVVTSVVLGEFVWALFKEGLCLQHRAELLVQRDHYDLILILIGTVGLLPWVALFVGLLAGLARLGVGQRSLALGCLGVFLAASLFFFLFPRTHFIRDSKTGDLADILFVRDFLGRQSPPAGSHPTFYSAYGKAKLVWLELKADSYIHDPTVKEGRIQNFKSWSPEMAPDPAMTCYGLEYFCFEGDGLWNARDADLIERAKQELAQIGLARPEDVVDGCIVRQPKAYPVYDDDYARHVATIREELESNYPNLHLVGRNGMHKYNNQDHAMMTAMLCARNILAGSNQYDLWQVNQDAEYHEAGKAGEQVGATGLRLVPTRVKEEEKVSASS
jgi:hypothetical protein